MKTITFAVPFLNEEENLRKFPERIAAIRKKLKARCLFVFVDDGSTDDSADIVRRFGLNDIILIRFSRNFGSHMALFAALEKTNSDYFTFMSADMQEPIELYENLFMRAKQGSEIVLGERQVRAASLADRLFSRGYNTLVRKFAFADYPANGVDIVFLGHTVIEAMRAAQEKNTSFYGVLFTLGFEKALVPYQQLPRAQGKSKWTLRKKLKLIADTFISFTVFPLRLVTFTGFALFFIGLAYGLYLIINTAIHGVAIQGWATLTVMLALGFGLNFLFLGIISEYLWRMFDQIRPRPRYVIREVVRQ